MGPNFAEVVACVVQGAAKLAQVSASWREFGPKLVQVGTKLAQVGASCGPWGDGGGHLVNFNENPQRFFGVQRRPWDQVKGCGDAPGMTKEAPKMHQGSSSEVPGDR